MTNINLEESVKIPNVATVYFNSVIVDVTKRDILKAALPILRELYLDQPTKDVNNRQWYTKDYLDYIDSITKDEKTK